MIPAELSGEKPFLAGFPDLEELVKYNFSILSAGFRKQKKWQYLSIQHLTA
jgi:hypothetical protein